MSEDQRIFLGLGSNIGDRYQNLKNGIISLNDHPHIWVTDKSHVYQSPAMYNTELDDFYNMVIEIDTNLADDINKSVIREQVELGVAVRMACLKIFCE
jgi:2-amino-4-hydroxy-6-hydroxymethyldihydropteridine diphosphokinase